MRVQEVDGDEAGKVAGDRGQEMCGAEMRAELRWAPQVAWVACRGMRQTAAAHQTRV